MRSQIDCFNSFERGIQHVLLATAALASYSPARVLASPVQDAPTMATSNRLTPAEESDFFTELEKRVTGIHSLEVTFTEEKNLAMFAQKVHCRGRMLFTQPDHIRWEMLEPFHSVLIVNGQKSAKYDWVDGKPRRLESGDEAMSAAIEQLTAWQQGRFRPHGGDFSAEVFSRQGIFRLVLTPTDKTMRRFIEQFELEIDRAAGRIVAITMHESAGDLTSIRFDQERRNVELPDAAFDVDNPRLP